MYYKIQKSLGNVSAVSTDSIPQIGICVEFRNFNREDASIIIYQNGKPEDVCINGWTFPCVYNKISHSDSDDIFGGKSQHYLQFEIEHIQDEFLHQFSCNRN